MQRYYLLRVKSVSTGTEGHITLVDIDAFVKAPLTAEVFVSFIDDIDTHGEAALTSVQKQEIEVVGIEVH